MQRQRVLLAFAIAWLSAAILSWAVYKRSTVPQSRDAVQVVAAAKDLPIGTRLQATDLRLITVDRKDLPKGVFLKTADLVDRAVAQPMIASELVLSSRLAAKGSGDGLSALIEPGARAISVQVNEISGVSGFIQPGTRVDVLFTRVFSNGDAATVTILQNVKVIAYGRQLDPAAKINPADNSRPTVATLLVTQEDAQKLVLAEQRGHIQLVLRNGTDDGIAEWSDPVHSADLGIEEPQKPMPPVIRAPDPIQVATKAKASEGRVIWVYRGDKLTQETIK